ncbi:MAG: 3-deoxy-7-phosphoheptulonate synthase [Candidatus Eremiobacteraeota bacterium]|nr:3-deoxy-7-phosphoheptulonate synthase [Candidatus Eremiobacteraeota bacterium]MBV8354416.1 3-deoxy-7-phosphoheptulonate synthase [Candidatus Eremiobacteraeota bacterium]
MLFRGMKAAPCVEATMVERGVNVPQSYRLVRRDARPDRTVVRLRSGASFGGDELAICAGPCGVESREQLHRAAQAVAQSGANVLRGGAYKPRTSPYSFQGLGEDALKLLREAADAHGLGVVTEVLDPRDVEKVAGYADMLQIGTRSMQNFPLLREAGASRMPVLLKRGLSATVQEWLLAAEYILLGGNENVVLCERGVRSFDVATRNLLDIAVVPLLEELTHLPVIVDPSHAMGIARLVPPVAIASLAAGAHGLLIEVHPDPPNALSDGAQSLDCAQFDQLMRRLVPVADFVGRRLPRPVAPVDGVVSARGYEV